MAQATIDTTVTGLQGVPVAANTPAVNQALVFNGTSWVPTTQNFLPLSGGTITGQLSVAASGSINSAGPITGSALNITGQSTMNGQAIVNTTGAGLMAPASTAPLWVSGTVSLDSYTGGATVAIRSALGGAAAPTPPVASGYMGGIRADGWNGSAFTTFGAAAINFLANQAWTAAANGTAIDFWVTPNGTTSAINALILNGTGASFTIPVYCTTGNFYSQASGSGNANFQLLNNVGQQAGALYWVSSSGALTLQQFSGSGGSISISTAGVVSTSGTITCGGTMQANTGYQCRAGTPGPFYGNVFNFGWTGAVAVWIDNVNQGNMTISSDYRVKKGVKVLGSMWAKAKALRPVSYTQAEYTPEIIAVRKDQGTSVPMFQADDVERWGFVAHELQETLVPSAASGVKDQPDLIQSPNPLTLLACVTKALQEAMARIEVLEGKLSRA